MFSLVDNLFKKQRLQVNCQYIVSYFCHVSHFVDCSLIYADFQRLFVFKTFEFGTNFDPRWFSLHLNLEQFMEKFVNRWAIQRKSVAIFWLSRRNNELIWKWLTCNNLHSFFDLTYFREVGQKHRNIFVRFLVERKTPKSHSEIKWPLAGVERKILPAQIKV